MKKSIYVETSIPSYLTARPSRDVRTVAWQHITCQWWDEARHQYQLYVSELVRVEAASGDPDAAERRISALEGIPELAIDTEIESLAEQLISGGAIPSSAAADALHIGIAAVHSMDYLLTWNCRHIDNAAAKPMMRSICAVGGYTCPEICTPLELLQEASDDV